MIDHSTYEVLVALAGAGPKDEFSELTGISDELKNALEEQIAADRKTQLAGAAKTIINVINAAKECVETSVKNIRAARIIEANEKAYLKELEIAKAYGAASGNYIPLLRIVAYPRSGVSAMRYLKEDESLYVVPEEFKKNFTASKKIVAVKKK